MRGSQVDLARQLLVDRLHQLVQRGHEAKDQLAAEMLLHGVGTTVLNCQVALVLEVQGREAAGILARVVAEPLGQVIRETIARMTQQHCCYQPDGNDFRYGVATTTLTAYRELSPLLQGYLDRLDNALVAEGAEDSVWV